MGLCKYSESAQCPSEENTRMDSARPWKYFCELAGLEKINEIGRYYTRGRIMRLD